MSKTILLFLCLLPALVWPQEPAAEGGAITKVVRVHTGARNLAALASGGSRVEVRADDVLKAIVLRGKPADVSALENTIRELDSASSNLGSSKNVELTVYLLSGSSSPAAESIPAAVTPVVKQLHSVFPYSNYQLLSTMLLRSGEGTPASTEGLLKAFGNVAEGSFPSSYSVSYRAARVSPDEAGPNIHLTEFHFGLRVAIGSKGVMFDVSIKTDVDLREGQKVVVGKSNIESADSALFVVLMAKLVQ
jgi:hypothetical protein